MRKLDLILRDWRIGRAMRYINRGVRLLDVGCLDGTLLGRVHERVQTAVGVDPIAPPTGAENLELIRDSFPGSRRFGEGQFDCITMLAVFEHVEDPQAVASECFRVLEPGGRAILSVPSPLVDHIIWLLRKLRLVDGMSTEQHHGFPVDQTPSIFERAGFRLAVRERFQLGLNNLFVFERPA